MSYTLKNKLLLGRSDNIYNYINSYIDHNKKQKDLINSEFLKCCKDANNFTEYINSITMYSFDDEAVRNLLDEILDKRCGDKTMKFIKYYDYKFGYLCPSINEVINGEKRRGSAWERWGGGC